MLKSMGALWVSVKGIWKWENIGSHEKIGFPQNTENSKPWNDPKTPANVIRPCIPLIAQIQSKKPLKSILWAGDSASGQESMSNSARLVLKMVLFATNFAEGFGGQNHTFGQDIKNHVLTLWSYHLVMNFGKAPSILLRPLQTFSVKCCRGPGLEWYFREFENHSIRCWSPVCKTASKIRLDSALDSGWSLRDSQSGKHSNAFVNHENCGLEVVLCLYVWHSHQNQEIQWMYWFSSMTLWRSMAPRPRSPHGP